MFNVSKLSSIATKTAFVFAFFAFAAPSQAASRASKKLGISWAVLGDPVPSVSSWQLKYNLTPMFQIFAAYGGGIATTYGGGVKAFLIPSWNFSPFIGGAYSMASVSGSFTLNGQSITLSGSEASVVTASFGVDHQADIGFNIGAGINYIFTPTELTDLIKILPHFYFGWVF